MSLAATSERLPAPPRVHPAPAPQHAGARRARAAALYREHGPAVYRRCLRLLKSPEAACDATQEVFLKLVRDLARLEDRATVLPWLYQVATNHCFNQARASRFRGQHQDEAALDLLPAAPDTSVPDRALARAVLERFDEVTRLVAVGILVDGMEQEEVADALGLSRRTVARKLERFVDLSRRFLQAADGPVPAGARTSQAA